MNLEKEIAELIADEVSWFNGWKASEEMFDKSCRKAARKVIKRLSKCACKLPGLSANDPAICSTCGKPHRNERMK